MGGKKKMELSIMLELGRKTGSCKNFCILSSMFETHLIHLCISYLEFGRYLWHLGYEVNYVRNFTDVDDKVSIKLRLG